MASFSKEVTSLGAIDHAARARGLCVLGAYHVERARQTRVLLAPDEPAGFWNTFQASDEASDGAPDPMNRWSERVVGGLADALGAVAEYPFSGPPWQPFHQWATATGRCHGSPVGLLVHDTAGLWVSFRGALLLEGLLELEPPPPNPCLSCPDQPCLDACPVGALGGDGYDVPACKSYLTGAPANACMTGGCRVRAACPVSQSWGRMPGQSAFHMAAFVGA